MKKRSISVASKGLSESDLKVVQYHKPFNADNPRKGITLDGLDSFPIQDLGLSKSSIKRVGDSVLIPLEILPFLKLLKKPKFIRKQETKERIARYHRAKKRKNR